MVAIVGFIAVVFAISGMLLSDLPWWVPIGMLAAVIVVMYRGCSKWAASDR